MLVPVPASVGLFMTVLGTAWGVWDGDAALLAVVLSRRSSRRLEIVLLEEPLERREKILIWFKDVFCALDQ